MTCLKSIRLRGDEGAYLARVVFHQPNVSNSAAAPQAVTTRDTRRASSAVPPWLHQSNQSGFSEIIQLISSGEISGRWRMKRTSCHVCFSPAGSGVPVPNAGIPVKRMPFSMM